MYAVVTIGAEQLLVQEGQEFLVQKLPAEDGAIIELDKVSLFASDSGSKVGAPFIEGAKVTATVVGQERGEHIIVFKKRRRQNSRRRNGHRQELTRVRIDAITG
jgi:large subunit ribosomal protein L21